MGMEKTLRQYFTDHRLDAFFVTDLFNVRYLTGFTGTNGSVIMTKKRAFIITDFRYIEQAKKQVSKKYKLVVAERDLMSVLKQIINKSKVKRLGFEANNISYSKFNKLKADLPSIKLVPINEDTATIRSLKTKTEIEKIQAACAVNKAAFEMIAQHIKPGKTEIEVARLLEMALLQKGAEKVGFDTIVASGWRGALPHGVASNKKIKSGELITIDFGCVVDGYNSDETITFCLGKPERRQKEIWQIVKDAQSYALESARPGVVCSIIDAAARNYITKKGYGKYFGHALGHGVGLEVHERPVLSTKSKDILEPGAVFTIEPGIYIPKFGGVRIEDVFVVAKNGVQKLTKIDKRLTVV